VLRFKSLLALTLVALAGIFSPAAQGAPVVVGYYTDFNETTTAPAQYIAQAGDIPVQILDISTANFNNFGKLFINNSNNDSPSAALQGRAADIANYVAGGGLFMYHSRNVAQGSFQDNQLLPGGAGISLTNNLSSEINVSTPGTLVTNGPFGTINDSTLDGGNLSNHGYALVSSLPPGAVSILNDGDPTHSVAFYYPFGDGFVYYSTIPLDFYLEGAGSNPPADEFRNIYTPNAITFVDSLNQQAVPEPATVLLLAGGLAGLVGWRCRRRKAA
jgi:hypothetical protein